MSSNGAVRKWVEDKGEDASIVATLPTLGQGDAHVWSPVFLGVSKVVHVARKRTADVSATPKVGERVVAPKELSPVDVDQIREAMRATIEKTKAEDPKELRKQIADLQRRLKTNAPVVDEQAVERAVSQAVAARDREWRERQAAMERQTKELTGRIEKIVALARLNGHAELPGAPEAVKAPARVESRRTIGAAAPHAAVATRAAEGELGKCERAILSVLSQFPEGCDKDKLTVLAGYHYSGGFRNSLGTLRRLGLIAGGNEEVMRITDAGLSLGPFPELPTGPDLADYWLSHRALGKCERAILHALLESRLGMTAEQLCEATGYEYSGGFRNSLGKLRTVGVIEGRNTETMRVSPELL